MRRPALQRRFSPRGSGYPESPAIASRTEAIDRIDARLTDIAKGIRAVERLLAVTGVGPITALAFYAVIGVPSRFSNIRDVGAYLGLVVRRPSRPANADGERRCPPTRREGSARAGPRHPRSASGSHGCPPGSDRWRNKGHRGGAPAPTRGAP